MGLQFNKTKVVERLVKHLEQADSTERAARSGHQGKLADWAASVEEWKEEAIDYYTDWVNAHENDGMVQTNIHNAPSMPSKPRPPTLTEATSIRHYIGQVECLEGDVITLSKGLLDGVGRYLA